mmetsp:Transcript_3129/g.8833  ORF Transcript_3129/g.8833 Transcript_3129/m.8833 type:complete len:81 (+) Transcript_3129:14-256(+)
MGEISIFSGDCTISVTLYSAFSVGLRGSKGSNSGRTETYSGRRGLGLHTDVSSLLAAVGEFASDLLPAHPMSDFLTLSKI